MASEISYIRLAGFRDFFPAEAAKEKLFYASSVGKGIIQKFCIHMLGHLRHEGFPDIDTFLRLAFTDNGYDYRSSPSYNALTDAFQKLQGRFRKTRFEIISIESLLSLFIWSENQEGLHEDGTADHMVIMLRLIELLLLFNDDVLANYQKAYESSRHGPEELRYHRLALATAFPQHDLVNADYAQLIFTQTYKLAKLLTFLDNDPEFQPLLAELLQQYDCTSNEEFLKALSAAVFIPLMGKQPGMDILQTDDWPDGKGAKFLNLLSYDSAALPDTPNDFKQLRERPLQDLQNGQFRVVYDLFLIKKAYNSLIFKLSELAPKIGMKIDVLGELRKRFSEGVLLYDVLGECFETADVNMPGDQIELEREPDSYVRKGKRVLLFESKDFYLLAKEKLSYDFDVIVAGLQKDGRLLKATVQTACNVVRVANAKFVFDQGYSPDDIRIYPVIVVHDALYSASSLNFWTNEWFKDELQTAVAKDGLGICNLNQVAPLTVIEIDSLILYKQHFNDGTLDLPTLIEEYHKDVRFADKGVKASFPFSEFLRDYCLRKDLVPDIPELIRMMKKFGL